MDDPMQGVFRGFDVAAAGLRAELQRSEIVAANLGNMHRTGNVHKEPYRRRTVVFEEVLEQAKGGRGADARGRLVAGTAVAKVVEDQTPFPVFHQPGHPDADENGNVLGSNVDVFQELVELAQAERSFDANLQAMRVYRTMLQNTITNMGAR
ncbi:MAG: flagellar basal body rod protein FlgC [Planctomycetes bacterium]|nr:flagellar basal body rod protein FlgC [Planctomycetota bacterium]